MKASDTSMRKVLVTTAHKGVFFGILAEENENENGMTVVLDQCRNCVYWTSDLKGFLGLAAVGPDENCRIGPATPSTKLTDVTSISDVTPEAIVRWEAEPWK